jgi:hypothetical protein
MEGLNFIRNGNTAPLSPQQLIDCNFDSSGVSNQGCNGGYQADALAWIKQNGGACEGVLLQKGGACVSRSSARTIRLCFAFLRQASALTRRIRTSLVVARATAQAT